MPEGLGNQRVATKLLEDDNGDTRKKSCSLFKHTGTCAPMGLKSCLREFVQSQIATLEFLRESSQILCPLLGLPICLFQMF